MNLRIAFWNGSELVREYQDIELTVGDNGEGLFASIDIPEGADIVTLCEASSEADQ